MNELSTKSPMLFSLPFKGRAGVGMGFVPVPVADKHIAKQTHPHPTLPLKGRALNAGV